MKYYIAIIKEDSQAMNAYEEINNAMESFHSELAYAYSTKTKTTCVILDELGNKICSEIVDIAA